MISCLSQGVSWNVSLVNSPSKFDVSLKLDWKQKEVNQPNLSLEIHLPAKGEYWKRSTRRHNTDELRTDITAPLRLDPSQETFRSDSEIEWTQSNSQFAVQMKRSFFELSRFLSCQTFDLHTTYLLSWGFLFPEALLSSLVLKCAALRSVHPNKERQKNRQKKQEDEDLSRWVGEEKLWWPKIYLPWTKRRTHKEKISQSNAYTRSNCSTREPRSKSRNCHRVCSSTEDETWRRQRAYWNTEPDRIVRRKAICTVMIQTSVARKSLHCNV